MKKLKIFFELIKFEHSVFALPFAYLGMVLASRPWPSWKTFFLVTLAMVSARTAGMTLNRIIDLKIDARNPRTQNRPIVTGAFSLMEAWAATVVATILFFLSAFLLNALCFKLSFAALFLLSTYHYVKRFSALCHFALGLVLAAAPMGGWLAVTGTFSWLPVLLSAAVLFWVAGFDIIYSLQDLEFDRTHGVHSIPVWLGEKKALQISRGCHVLTLLFLGLLGIFTGLGGVYWAGIVIAGALLFIEQKLVWDGDLTKINAAFFTINGWIGILMLIFTVMDKYR